MNEEIKTTVNFDDFSEESRWVIECPKCNNLTETLDDPQYEEYITCEHCNEILYISE